jgi:hypothetical protein
MNCIFAIKPALRVQGASLIDRRVDCVFRESVGVMATTGTENERE